MIITINKKAKRDYEIHKKFLAGMVLDGSRVKSIRNKQININSSFVKIINNEVFLINPTIHKYKYSIDRDYDPNKNIKLLLTKKEIATIKQALEKKGWAVIPLNIQIIRKYIKAEIALAKGKKEYQKKEDIKKRDLKRRLAKQFKQNILKI